MKFRRVLQVLAAPFAVPLALIAIVLIIVGETRRKKQ